MRLSLVLAWMAGLAAVPAAQNSVVVWGSRTQAEVPADATNLASVATSTRGCVGVGRDGTVHAWGYIGGSLSVAATNAFAATMVSRPVILRRDGLVVYGSGLVSGVSNAVAVAAAQSYGAGALRQDGVFSGWDGLWSPRSGTTNIVAIAGGGYATIDVLYSDGTVSGYGVPQAYLSSLSNVVAIAKSWNQTVWLKSDGTVAAYPFTNTPAGLSNAVAVAAGDSHVLALRNDGTVCAWGDNASGQTNVPANLSGVVAIAAGTGHSLALKADGTVVAWGRNNAGQTSVPSGLTNVAAIFACADYSLALVGASPPALLSQLPDETVWSGQPATFTLNAVGSAPLRFQWQHNGEIIPDATNAFFRIERASAADAGLYNVIVSNARGTVASRESRLNVRANPFLLTQPASQSKVFGDSVTFSVSVGSQTTPSYQWYWNGDALAGATQANLTLSDLSAANVGGYWCVVSNAFSCLTSTVAQLTVVLPVGPTNQVSWIGGQVDFTATNAGSKSISWQWFTRNGPVAGATQALLSLRNLPLDQADDYWAVATGTFGSCTSAPVRLSINGFAAWGEVYNLPTNVPSVAALGTGWYQFFVERGDGAPQMWGLYDFGADGSGNADVPAGVSNIVALAGGAGHSIALLGDGTVRVWGRSDFGAANIPAGLANVVAVAAGTYHCMALKADGTVRAWGGFYSTLAVPAGLDHVVSIASRADHMMALRSDGTVVAWGEDQSGETHVPAGLRNVVGIAAGYAHSVALRADGTVVVWGSNGLGQTNVPPGLSSVVAIAAGFYHTLALRSDGTVVSWGYQATVPPGLRNVVAIAAGGYGNLAIVEPGLAAAPVHIAGATRACGGFSLEVPTQRAKTYYLQYRDSLADPWWTPLPPVIGDGTVKTLADSPVGAPQRFYRVWQKP